jgi:hypothetical protein
MTKFTTFLTITLLCTASFASQAAQKDRDSAYYTHGSTIELLTANRSSIDPDHDGDSKGYNYFSMHRQATGNKVFIFDPSYGAWALYDRNGNRLNTGRASGGKGYCPDINRGCRTIRGTFRIIAKGGPGCVSSRFPVETHGGAPMPYCMYFTASGYAVHGSYDVPNYNASHGCIRVTPTAARWLSQNHMSIGTTVIVRSY